jgi:hypothetical protein
LGAYLRSESGRGTVPAIDSRRYAGLSRDGRPLTEALQSPIIGVLSSLKRGDPPDKALALGLVRARRSASFEAVQTPREALLDAIEDNPRVEGFQRQVAGTCAACMALSGEPNMEVHPGCQCMPVPRVTPRAVADVFAGREFRVDALDPFDAAIITRYFGSVDSFLVNRALRGTGAMGSRLEQTVNALDEAIESAGAIGTPVRVQRVIVGDVGKMVGTPGSTVTDLGFGSTTTSREWLEEFLDQRPAFLGDGDAIVLDLDVNPQVKALWGANPGESELLLQRGCRYVVEKVEKEGDRWRVKATVLPPA